MKKRNRAVTILIVFAGFAFGGFLFISGYMGDPNNKKTETAGDPVASASLPALSEARLVIRKRNRVLDVYDGDRLVRSYPIVLGFAPDGDKEKEGDGKTPEGEFYVFTKNPRSKFHLSLGISYPSKKDAVRGHANGSISAAERDQIMTAIDRRKMPPQKTALGGEIYIHGGGVLSDWTWGCIAMNNADIEELYAAIDIGATVIITP